MGCVCVMHIPSEYLLFITDPRASYTLREVMFSDAIRFKQSRRRIFSPSMILYNSGSVSFRGLFSARAALSDSVVALRNAKRYTT